jgi:eukaryotic-like serine/threonine-protein kinase
MELAAGTRLGPYEILGRIGAGGMGEVYRARDPRLDRIVAIKVSKVQFSARFEREARVIAALNHPNICQIYDVGPNYLVMEFIDGQPLKGPLAVQQAFEYATQICDALDAAHRKTITHRDLKPPNILVTKTGVVKLLDFGLAKIGPAVRISEDDETQPMELTAKGEILGTLHYMAPEQLEGLDADARTDIFALGVVLYEVLTGKRAFSGDSPASVIATILQSQVPSVDKLVSPAFDDVLRRCFEKNPENRWQSVRDVKIAMEMVAKQRLDSAPAVNRSRPGVWMAACGLLAAALAAGIGLYWRMPAPLERTTKTFILPPDNAALNGNSLPAVSPDGKRIAFAGVAEGTSSLWIRDLDSLITRILPGTEGAFDPFWSPDSRSIAFFANGRLKRIDLTGGPALTIGDAPVGRGGAWSEQGVIVYTPTARAGLVQIPAMGGNSKVVTILDHSRHEDSHRFPWFLPDGHRFLYTAMSLETGKSMVYIGDTASDPARQRQSGFSSESNAIYSPPGYILFVRERALMAQPFDAGKGQPTGESTLIAEHVDYISGNVQGQFSVSRNGVLTYIAGALAGNAQLTWFDHSGKSVSSVGSAGILAKSTLSPDGKTIMVARQDPQTGFFDLWLHELAANTATRFTFDSTHNDDPVWSPDGEKVAFRTTRHGDWALYVKATRGDEPEMALDREPRFKVPADWSRDGRYILEEVIDSATKGDIWLLPMQDDKKPVPILRTAANERSPRVSPDGKWLAFVSDESGRDEVYVQGFTTASGAAGNRWQISTNGGTRPVWSHDGKDLYFIGLDRRMMAVSLGNSGGSIRPGDPQALFDSRIASGDNTFDVAANGHFLLPIAAGRNTTAPLTLVVNWLSSISKR